MSILRKFRTDVYLLVLMLFLIGVVLYLESPLRVFSAPVAKLPMYVWLLLMGLLASSLAFSMTRITRGTNSPVSALASIVTAVLWFLLFWQQLASTGWTGAILLWAIVAIHYAIFGCGAVRVCVAKVAKIVATCYLYITKPKPIQSNLHP